MHPPDYLPNVCHVGALTNYFQLKFLPGLEPETTVFHVAKPVRNQEKPSHDAYSNTTYLIETKMSI